MTNPQEITEKLKEQIRWLQDAHERNRIYHFYKDYYMMPNPRQAELLEAWANPEYKIFTYTGANRSGKTTIGAILAWCTIFGRFPWDEQRLHFRHNKPRKVRYIGQDWEKHIATVVIPALAFWWPKDRELETKKNSQGYDHLWIDKKTKSSLEIMSNRQETDLHEGWEGDLIIYDEPPKREIRVANARGLVDREGRELFCMTLLKEAWVDREVIKARLPDGRPDPSVFNVHAEIYDNVGFGLTEQGVKQFAKTLTDEEKEARLRGIPSYMSGLVYPTFNRHKHLVKRFNIPLNWIVDIGIDVHPRERQAVLFLVTNPREDRYGFHEIWDHADPISLAERIVRFAKANVLRVNKIIVDPLAKGDSNNPNTMFDLMNEVFYSHGYRLDIAVKDRELGILQVKKHLIGPNNMPSIFFFNDLKRTIYEIEGYMYDEEGRLQDKDDHMMENLYRLLLLNTRYVEPEDEEEYEGYEKKTHSAWTGY